jgi:hypothetical protein
MAKKLTEAELGAIISQQIELARSHDSNGGGAKSREKALDYFFGTMDAYVPPEANRSKVVSRDVADAIGWYMPEIMRVFTASGRMFVAEAVEPEDVEYADQVSDALNYVFWKDNFGYGNVYDGTWGSLLHGDGIVKTFFDDTPVFGPAKLHEGLTEDQLAMLAGDDRVEVLAKTERDGMMPDEYGMEVPVKLYDVKLRIKKADGKFTITVIPREDFLMDADAITTEDAAFKDHWQRKTRSDLVAMGYDKDEIWEIPEASRNETPEAQARRIFNGGESATDRSMELVDYHECYIRVDVDGDGEAELIRACFGGPGGTSKGALLDWEVWEDEDPFDNIPCEPIPHRFGARSLADEEFDVQDVKTVLRRQLLNNTYWVNNPQRFVAGKVKNPDQLDNPTFGGTVFGDQGTTITELPVPYIGDKTLLAIRDMDEVSARRTGINGQSMALDPEVLQNQSATANQNAMNASRSQPELVARNMAEYGWSKVGEKLLRLMHTHAAKQKAADPENYAPRTILVKGKPVQIDPATWNPDMHVNVNTGLGTGSRDKDAMMLGQVLQQQIAFTDRIGMAFPGKALEMLPYLHNTLTRFAEATGLKNPELYWPEIDPAEIEEGKKQLAQPKPDPAIELEKVKSEGRAEVEQIKAQTQSMLADKDAEVTATTERLKAEGNAFKENAQAEADIIVENNKRLTEQRMAQVEYGWERYKFDEEMKFKRDELTAKTEIERNKPKPEPKGQAAN